MASSRENLQTFRNWILGKSAQDFSEMTYRGSLHRETIAIECGFSKSVLLQNPKIKALLKELEDRLRAENVLRPALLPKTQSTSSFIDELESKEALTADPASHRHRAGPSLSEGALDQRTGHSSLESTVRRLQSENASQRAEIRELRHQLSKLRELQEALCTTGRLPR
ncbi:VPA1267 family protein [Pseudomonas sp. UM16]